MKFPVKHTLPERSQERSGGIQGLASTLGFEAWDTSRNIPAEAEQSLRFSPQWEAFLKSRSRAGQVVLVPSGHYDKLCRAQ